MANFAENVYKKTGIETATKGELIVMLYNAAIKNLDEAISHIDNFQKYDVVNNKIIKTTEIINELKNSLDQKSGGEIAQKLDSIYAYALQRLFEANNSKSKEILEEIRSYLKELNSSWKEIASGKGRPADIGLQAGGFSLKG